MPVPVPPERRDRVTEALSKAGYNCRFSAPVIKTSRRGYTQARFLAVTDSAVLMCTKSGTVNRAIAAPRVKTVTVAHDGCETLLSIPSEYDLLVRFSFPGSVELGLLPALSAAGADARVVRLGAGERIGSADHPVYWGDPTAAPSEARTPDPASPPRSVSERRPPELQRDMLGIETPVPQSGTPPPQPPRQLQQQQQQRGQQPDLAEPIPRECLDPSIARWADPRFVLCRVVEKVGHSGKTALRVLAATPHPRPRLFFLGMRDGEVHRAVSLQEVVSVHAQKVFNPGSPQIIHVLVKTAEGPDMLMRLVGDHRNSRLGPALGPAENLPDALAALAHAAGGCSGGPRAEWLPQAIDPVGALVLQADLKKPPGWRGPSAVLQQQRRQYRQRCPGEGCSFSYDPVAQAGVSFCPKCGEKRPPLGEDIPTPADSPAGTPEAAGAGSPLPQPPQPPPPQPPPLQPQPLGSSPRDSPPREASCAVLHPPPPLQPPPAPLFQFDDVAALDRLFQQEEDPLAHRRSSPAPAPTSAPASSPSGGSAPARRPRHTFAAGRIATRRSRSAAAAEQGAAPPGLRLSGTPRDHAPRLREHLLPARSPPAPQAQGTQTDPPPGPRVRRPCISCAAAGAVSCAEWCHARWLFPSRAADCTWRPEGPVGAEGLLFSADGRGVRRVAPGGAAAVVVGSSATPVQGCGRWAVRIDGLAQGGELCVGARGTARGAPSIELAADGELRIPGGRAPLQLLPGGFARGDVVGVSVDCANGAAAFDINGVPLGREVSLDAVLRAGGAGQLRPCARLSAPGDAVSFAAPVGSGGRSAAGRAAGSAGAAAACVLLLLAAAMPPGGAGVWGDDLRAAREESARLRGRLRAAEDDRAELLERCAVLESQLAAAREAASRHAAATRRLLARLPPEAQEAGEDTADSSSVEPSPARPAGPSPEPPAGRGSPWRAARRGREDAAAQTDLGRHDVLPPAAARALLRAAAQGDWEEAEAAAPGCIVGEISRLRSAAPPLAAAAAQAMELLAAEDPVEVDPLRPLRGDPRLRGLLRAAEHLHNRRIADLRAAAMREEHYCAESAALLRALAHGDTGAAADCAARIGGEVRRAAWSLARRVQAWGRQRRAAAGALCAANARGALAAAWARLLRHALRRPPALEDARPPAPPPIPAQAPPPDPPSHQGAGWGGGARGGEQGDALAVAGELQSLLAQLGAAVLRPLQPAPFLPRQLPAPRSPRLPAPPPPAAPPPSAAAGGGYPAFAAPSPRLAAAALPLPATTDEERRSGADSPLLRRGAEPGRSGEGAGGGRRRADPQPGAHRRRGSLQPPALSGRAAGAPRGGATSRRRAATPPARRAPLSPAACRPTPPAVSTPSASDRRPV